MNSKFKPKPYVFELVFQHPETKEIKTKHYSLDELIEEDEYYIYHVKCDQHSIDEYGEGCNCQDYYYDKFECIAKRLFTGMYDKDKQSIFVGDICISDETLAPFVVTWKNLSGVDDFRRALNPGIKKIGDIYRDADLIKNGKVLQPESCLDNKTGICKKPKRCHCIDKNDVNNTCLKIKELTGKPFDVSEYIDSIPDECPFKHKERIKR